MRVGLLGSGYLGQTIGQLLQLKKVPFSITTTTPTKLQSLQKSFGCAHLLKSKDQFALEQWLKPLTHLIICIAPKEASYSQCYLQTSINIKPFLKNLHQTIVISSTGVYEDSNGEPVDENSPTTQTGNGSILVKTEHNYLSSTSSSILRLGQVYGYERPLENALYTDRPFISPNNRCNLTHVVDASRAVIHVLNAQLFGIWNVCDFSNCSRQQLYEWLSQLEKIPYIFKASTEQYLRSNKQVISNKLKASGFEWHYPKATSKQGFRFDPS